MRFDPKRIARSLEKAREADFTRMREEHFTAELLPYLANVEGDPDLNVQLLVTIAKGNYNPIIVVDRADNELFRVPPLLQRLDSDNLEGAESMFEVLQTDELYRKTGQPALADAMLIKRFNQLTLEDNSKHTLEYLKQWIQIENRYDIEIPRFNNVRVAINSLLSNDNSPTKAIVPAADELSEDDFEDDDD